MPGATRGSSLPMVASHRDLVVKYNFLTLFHYPALTVSYGRDPERRIECQAAEGGRRAAVSNITARWGDPACLRNHPRVAEPDRLRRLHGDAFRASGGCGQGRRWRKRRRAAIQI